MNGPSAPFVTTMHDATIGMIRLEFNLELPSELPLIEDFIEVQHLVTEHGPGGKFCFVERCVGL